ncbi:MAG: putative bifunctional diguanylate cyclase/phosphodiesterase [Hyphomicrobiaceae bacterium]
MYRLLFDIDLNPVWRLWSQLHWWPGRRCASEAQLAALHDPSAREQLLAIAEVTSDWIWLTDSAHRFVYVSPKVYDHIKLRPEDLIGRTRRECISVVPGPGLTKLEMRVRSFAPFKDIQYSWIGDDACKYHVEVSGKPLWNTDGSFAGYLGSGRCITDRIEQELNLSRAHSELKLRAQTDPLTGLYNRDFFNRTLHQLCSDRRSSFLLILVDLDHFKKINDSIGHQAGDQVLVEFAKRLVSVARCEDLVCRIGGDEFAILAQAQESLDAGASMAGRLLDLLQRPIEADGRQLIVSSSVGIDGLNADSSKRDAHTLIRNADLALYRAKSLGRSKAICFDEEIESSYREENELLIELEDAIALRKIEAYFQPIVDVESRGIVGVESLARWQRSNGEFVSPIKFITLAEQHGLIDELGKLVLAKAIEASRQLDDSIYVSFNVSIEQLGRGDFLDTVQAELKRHDASARRFHLEVTESVCMGENQAVLDELEALSALGIQVVLDDFGAGHSSLFYLQRFAFSKIKLDRAFLNNIEMERSRAILYSISALADAMGTPVVAEGVETDRQLQVVRSDGIAEAQGYLFYRPMPLSDLHGLALEHGIMVSNGTSTMFCVD